MIAPCGHQFGQIGGWSKKYLFTDVQPNALSDVLIMFIWQSCKVASSTLSVDWDIWVWITFGFEIRISIYVCWHVSVIPASQVWSWYQAASSEYRLSVFLSVFVFALIFVSVFLIPILLSGRFFWIPIVCIFICICICTHICFCIPDPDPVIRPLLLNTYCLYLYLYLYLHLYLFLYSWSWSRSWYQAAPS